MRKRRARRETRAPHGKRQSQRRHEPMLANGQIKADVGSDDMSKVILKTALATAIALQAGCAPLYKGLWLDKVLEQPSSALSGPTTVPAQWVPIQPTPVRQAPVATRQALPTRAVSTTAVAATQTQLPIPVPPRQSADKNDHAPSPGDFRTALGPGSTGAGSGPSQVVMGGSSSPQKSLISSGSGSGPSQAARNPSRTNRR